MMEHRGCNKQVSEHATDVSDEFNDRALVGHNDVVSEEIHLPCLVDLPI